MSEHIPAWKRIGLSVKKELQVDPLAITTTTDPARLSAKQLKKLKRTRDDTSDISDTTRKEPKRPKLPKDKKPPPPEKDQLAYLRQFTEDKSNWKFAKSRQNWILKNLFKIESKYDLYLQNYVKGLQGGSKDRLVNELKEIVAKWNKINEELELKLQKNLERDDDDESDAEIAKEDSTKAKKEDNNDKKEAEGPEYDEVVKSRVLIHAMTGEFVELKGIDELELNASNAAEPEKDNDKTSSVESIDEDDNTATNSQSNLIVEEVEVTDFVSAEDYEDPQVSETDEENEKKSNLSPEEKILKSAKKDKKKNKKKTTDGANSKDKKDKKKKSKKDKKVEGKPSAVA